MHKFGQFICKYRKVILIVAILLLVPSVLGIKATKINYDLLVYLPQDVETIQGENILAEDFQMGAFSIVILENMETKDILKLEDAISQIENVEKMYLVLMYQLKCYQMKSKINFFKIMQHFCLLRSKTKSRQIVPCKLLKLCEK